MIDFLYFILDDFIALCLRDGLSDYLQQFFHIGLASNPRVRLKVHGFFILKK